jgi:hypothetical protein
MEFKTREKPRGCGHPYSGALMRGCVESFDTRSRQRGVMSARMKSLGCGQATEMLLGVRIRASRRPRRVSPPCAARRVRP